jgi:hypothetical protein
MKKIILTAALSALAGMPLAAMQPGAAPKAGTPHTVHSELTVYQEVSFNGQWETLETPSSTVHTDWPIRSIAVHPGDSWQICGRTRFRDPCIVLNRSVVDARMIGIENQIGSARLAPTAPPAALPPVPPRN